MSPSLLHLVLDCKALLTTKTTMHKSERTMMRRRCCDTIWWDDGGELDPLGQTIASSLYVKINLPLDCSSSISYLLASASALVVNSTWRLTSSHALFIHTFQWIILLLSLTSYPLWIHSSPNTNLSICFSLLSFLSFMPLLN